MKISLCMIVKNEQDTLARCLTSIKPAVDEIIIIDTGSTDNTKQIANKFTDKVYDFKWVNDFSKARNFAFSFASCDYIMWLDADDVVSNSDLKKIIDLKNQANEGINAFYFKYNVAFDKNDKPTFFYYRERIVKKSANPVWIEPIHEVISYVGNHKLCDISINHKKLHSTQAKRNLKIFKQTLKEGKKLSPRLTFYYARELMYNNYFKKAIKVFEEFLKNNSGWVENKIEACLNLAHCYKNINNQSKALISLFNSFNYDVPRAECLCKIAEIFLAENKLLLAKYWYEKATECKINNDSLAFIQTDYYDYIPYLQLCVINDMLGNKAIANEYNEFVGKIRPDCKAYLYNKEYFKNS